MPQVVTLQDLRCISSMGVIKGTSWKVPQLEDSHYRFGTAPSDAATPGDGDGREAQLAALEELLSCLLARDAASESLENAKEVSLLLCKRGTLAVITMLISCCIKPSQQAI